MGLLDFLPPTTDPQELEERKALEQALKGVMSSRNDQARGEAVRALVEKVGETRAVELLIDVFQEKSLAETPVTLGAVLALRYLGPQAMELLARAVCSESPVVRKRAAMALGKIGDKKAIEALTPLLKDRTSYVRETAQDALDALIAADG